MGRFGCLKDGPPLMTSSPATEAPVSKPAPAILEFRTRGLTAPARPRRRSVEEGFRLQRHRNESDQARGCNPARVTVTSRRTAALDGRLLAAVRAWRQ